MHDGKRWRMRVDDFALAREGTEPVTVKQTAEKLWEPRFLAEIIAGHDPTVPPNVPKVAAGLTVSGFLDLYYANYVEAEGLRDPVTINSRLKAVKAVLGDLPVTALEKPADILRFKADYRKGREVASARREAEDPSPRGARSSDADAEATTSAWTMVHRNSSRWLRA